jgi:hypothetical protein
MNVPRFRRIVQAVLLSTGPCVTVACSSSESATEMPERAQCVDLSGANRYSALTLAPGVEGIAFANRGSIGSPAAVMRLPALGAPCAGASDRDACARRIDELLADPSSPGWTVSESTCGGCARIQRYDLGVITSGSDVRIATLDDVVRATAPVSSRDEAAAILQLKGYSLDCDMNNVRPEADGWTFKRTTSSCSGEAWETFYKVVSASGQIVETGRHQLSEADNNCIEGRRPANLASTGVSWLSSLAACFGEIAHMEAAAVLAFDELQHRLRALGAPPEILARAARARQDEVAHAAITARLAHRFGGTPSTPRIDTIAPQPEPSMLQLARENAVEGCVREAYGALVAAFQAANASDAEVRASFRRIALDEAEHAELSFAIDAWLTPLLTADERRCVEEAKAQAWLDLAASCNVEPAAEVVSVAGIPTSAQARALLASLSWAVSDLAA